MKKFLTTTLVVGAISATIFLKSSQPPGALNPAVTQENIYTTVCVAGYTGTIRPAPSYTSKLKVEQMQKRGLPGYPSEYEEDHLISLVLGGHPTDPKNLWPEPYPEARHKDLVESYLHRELCAGHITLADAQKKVKNWEPIYTKLRTNLGATLDLTDDDQDDE